MVEKNNRKVAYFSMEVGITAKIPTYSGGLGVLAGDTLKAAADVSFPMVGITLLNKRGYFFQDIKNGVQNEVPTIWSINDFLKPVDAKVTVNIKGEDIAVGAWLTILQGIDGYEVPLFFLHTDLPENSEEARKITDHLYGDGNEYRLQQEIILGVGGIRMLNELGFTNLDRYHMNEGHSALLTLELCNIYGDKEEVRKKCVFTTHTPVPAGHDKFDIKKVEEVLEENLFKSIPNEYIEQGELNMTALALDASSYINGVAKKHAEVSKSMFPRYPIQSITNGVHAQTWVSAHFAYLYDQHIPDWKRNPDSLRSITSVPRQDIWNAHYEAKKQIIDYVNANTNAGLDYDYFTLGWARRFTSYKRPDFLLQDTDRLRKIAEKHGPLQIIYAGKAHPKDTEGKELIKKIITLSKELNGQIKMVYLENYDMYLSKYITSGVDAWLNTPLPPHEASGTSGMKCALNGVPQISVLDGWWHEGYVENETGWAFSTSEELYDVLEHDVVNTFYNDLQRWVEIMQKTIMLNGSFFNSHRMINEYIKMAYRI